MDTDVLSKRYTSTTAERYDTRRAGSRKWKREQAAVDHMLARIPRGASILDVPIGTGRFLESYLRYGLHATGVDASADMLAECHAKAQRGGMDVALHAGDIFGLDFEDGQFDAALCIRFLNWIALPDAGRALGELVRVSRQHVIVGVRHDAPPASEGRATLARWSLRARRWYARRRIHESGLVVHDAGKLRSLLERLGLDVVDVVPVDPRADGSDYFVYLLRRASERGRSTTASPS